MPMIKLIGTLLMLVTAGLAVLLGIRRERRRLSVSDGWIELIGMIRTQIVCYRRPLDEILEGLKFEGVDDTCNPHERLVAVLEESAPYLSPTQFRTIEAFVRQIGQGYVDDQRALCDHTLDTLRPLCDALYKEHPVRVRLVLTVTLGACLGCSILLW